MSVVRVQHLSKHYKVHERKPGVGSAIASLFRRETKTVRAVDDISFSIDAGERVGFLGPNGAGKTTTLKVLSGLLHPTSGEVRVNDYVPQKRDDAFLKQIMLVMGQKQQLIWDLPPAETFEMNRAIYDVPRKTFNETIEELVPLLDLKDVILKPTRELSLGERMKCELLAALIHRPKLLFLDEPTIGLDVSMQVVIRNFIRSYNERWGATLILTSHYMDDVAALCPRIIVIDKGRISYDGGLADLSRKIRPEKRIVLRFGTPVADAEVSALGDVVSSDPQGAVLRVAQDAVNQTVTRALASLPVTDLTVENPPLEEVMSEFFAQTRVTRADDAGRDT